MGKISESFEVKTVLRQCDALSPVLFNLAPEQVIRDMKDSKSIGLVGNRNLLAYADDIDILGESQDQIISSTFKLIEASLRIELKINGNKTKYMIMTRHLINKQNLNIDQYTFEQVDNFKYLGVNINANNNMHNEIHLRLAAANRSYFAMNKMFKSRLLLKESKVKLYMTYLHPVIMYGCETWSTSKGNERKLLRFERKILRRIYGPIRNPDNGEYERRKNTDIERFFNKPSIQSFLIAKILEWAGYV